MTRGLLILASTASNDVGFYLQHTANGSQKRTNRLNNIRSFGNSNAIYFAKQLKQQLNTATTAMWCRGMMIDPSNKQSINLPRCTMSRNKVSNN